MTLYVVHTVTQLEAAVAEELTARKVGWYLPREKRLGRRAGRADASRPITSPLFPGYLFVDLDERSPRFDLVRSVAGVLGFLSLAGAGQPAPVSAARVWDLMGAEVQGAFDRTPRKRRFLAGQAVRVTGGPFSGFMAQIVGDASATGRLRVLTRFLGGGVMEIDADKLEAA